MNDTSTLRARIHDSAIGRVTRMFAATIADIFSETLQNARRAGATRVRVILRETGEDRPLSVTVADDGTGIADPAVLLSFGENGWNEDLVRREDAAGMGFLSLARRGCAVASRPRDSGGDPAPGWRAELTPEHFVGEAGAAVEPDDSAPFPHGTAVTFDAMRRNPPTRSAARSKPPPAITRCRCSSSTVSTRRPAARRWRAGLFSTAPCTWNAGEDWCSACSPTASAAGASTNPK